MKKLDDTLIDLQELNLGGSIVSARQLDIAAIMKKLRPIVGLGNRTRAKQYPGGKGRKRRNDYD